MHTHIDIKGAIIHNLKGVDVTIPRDALTVITGVSGSGKSSLAFDTLYEEGKRRYLMFSGTQFMVDSVPTFESINGLSPTVAVEQRIIRQSNPRSTVGTRTKINNMLAALFASFGKRYPMHDDGLPLSMEMFMRNSPKGMCVKCLGNGMMKKLDEERIFEDGSQKLYQPYKLDLGYRGSTRKMLDAYCNEHKLDINQSVSELTDEQRDILIYGGRGFMGYIPWIMQIINGAFSSSGRLAYLLGQSGHFRVGPCTRCHGSGMNEYAATTTVAGKTITQLNDMYIRDLLEFLRNADIKQSPLLKEIIVKLDCMVDVGLHHLALSRPVPTLSGGEIQRLFLASYIIAEMDGIIFIFDEPTIGLHEVEKHKLISILQNLIKRGNTVIAVEHDENFMRIADYIIDLGPDAGIYGGERIFQGSYADFLKCTTSRTAPYLVSKRECKQSYKPIDPRKQLTIQNAHLHNLRNVTAEIPLGLMVGVAGVSGSGKSSLISDTLVPELKQLLKSKCVVDEDALGEYSPTGAKLLGVEHIGKCVIIDQKPIGRTRTSCPATYTGVMDKIRTLYAKYSGKDMGLFSINAKGRCRRCKGDGEIHYHVGYGNFIDMECEDCGGTGFIEEAIAVELDGKNIRDVLHMTVDEAADFFCGKSKSVADMLSTLRRVGMGYITLGQKTTTISGGESQRIKLAKELSKANQRGDTLYIMDEPTTGLSFHDTHKLMKLMQELVDNGNSVIVTEHDPYILSNCDYIIELGVGGGSDGGNIIATGTPAALKQNSQSIIGGYLL